MSQMVNEFCMGKLHYIKLGYVFILVSVPIALGTTYAIHNTDTPHWGFILGTILDYQQGRNLFTEVYVQYGLGLNYLISLLSYFIPASYTNIGILVSLVYAGTLLLIYVSVNHLSSFWIGLIVSLITLLIHPYAIYPWPDYFAGFFLALTVLVFTKKPKFSVTFHFIAGMLMFSAVMFRNTYVINIIAAGVLFLACNYFDRQIFHAGIYLSYFVFLLFLGGYISLLYYHGNLSLWYSQVFGAANKSYGVEASGVYTLLYKILNPGMVETLIFSLLFILCLTLVLLFTFIKSPIGNNSETSLQVKAIVIFLSILGMTGFVQCTMIYEVFRLQNACLPLFAASAFWIQLVVTRYDFSKYNMQLRCLITALILMLVVNLPVQLSGKWGSTYWPILEPPFSDNWNKYVINSTIPALIGHRLLPDVDTYYSGLARGICGRNTEIVNLTRDPLIPYLCKGSRNKFYLPMFSRVLLDNISPSQLNRIRQRQFQNGDLVVYEEASDQDPMLNALLNTPNRKIQFRKLGEWIRPKSIRWLTPTRVHLYEISADS